MWKARRWCRLIRNGSGIRPETNGFPYGRRIPSGLPILNGYQTTWGRCTRTPWRSGKVMQITDGMSDAKYPVFDKDGKYLYFTASTDSGPSLQPDVGSFIKRPVTRSVYLAVLTKDQPSPFAPESDEEKIADASKPDAPKPEVSATDKPKPDAVKSPAPKIPDVKIDFENISQRILAMPLPPRRYVGLQAGKAG